MKLHCLLVLAVVAFVAVPRASAQEYPERWILGYGKSIIEKEGAEDFIALIKEAKRLGYTHVVYDEVYNQTMRAMPPKYFEHIAMVKQAAESEGITIVPGIFNAGYSWRVIWYDNNLAAGLPARDVPFVVKGTIASADPAAVPALANTSFETQENQTAVGWKPNEGTSQCIAVDSQVRHSGYCSLRMTDFDRLARDERDRPVSCHVTQTVAVEPFKYYRLTIWRKTQDLQASGSSVNITPTDRSRRRLCYTNFEIDPVQDWEDFVTPTQDWRQFQLTFNTLEATSIDIQVGVDGGQSGTIWWDDVKIEPAGLANLLRSDTKPFVVKSADGAVVYEEGRDFIHVEDPLMGKSPMPAWLSYLPPGGSFDVWHPGPAIRLTPNSRIKDGERLLVSYYHPHIVYGHQVVGSLTDPKILDVFEEQMQYVVKYWNAPAYFMGYDEIRTGGWEVQPGGTDMKVAELLARQISSAVEIARKYAPDANLYVWSDMFDPFHNARKLEGEHGYYLCNGDFYGSWEGLPSDVRIIKWGGGGRDCLKFFADRGHKIVISGGSSGQVERWKEAAQGIQEVIGFMYTNWQSDYSRLGDYMQAIESEAAAAE